MKILILGSGLMGPAAAYNALQDSDVSQVTLCDIDQQRLDAAQAQLESLQVADKLTTMALDLNDQAAATKLMTEFDVVLGALPPFVIPLAVRAAAAAGKPIVDLLWPTDAAQRAAPKPVVEQAGTLVVLGCGVEPGMSEIVARHLADKLDQVDELHIKVGGVPENPAPPLGYKIVFGGQELPLQADDARIIENGKLKPLPRYSEPEPVFFSGVGQCEAWHEGIFPWLLDLESLKGLKIGTQKTVRWPGYAEKATVLKEMGFFSREPIEVDGTQIAPKKFLDTLLFPHVKLEEGERDITLFRVEVSGEKDGYPRKYKVEMVDYLDKLGFTSMARTTAFTGAIIARMVGRGEVKAKGMFTPEQAITGPLFKKLVEELAAAGVRFELTTQKVKEL